MDDLGELLTFGVIILVVWFAWSHFHKDKEEQVQQAANGGYYYQADDSEPVEMENPFDYGSGHGAGYEWAESSGGNCNTGNSSFDEGCKEYYYQESGGGY
jgi:hypothetical protein